jgi:HPt (histidine-containing phosphotransfer) domain-containing protein
MSEADPENQTLDFVHLEQQTFGDNALARDLLGLFAQQCTRLVPAIQGETALMSRADAAHTLKGGALAVGAGGIAALSDAIEVALARGEDGIVLEQLSGRLDDAVVRFRDAVAAYAGRVD